MSEHNTQLTIREIFSEKEKIKTFHIIDNEGQLYIVDVGDKSKSVIAIDGAKIDHKEIFKFINDFMEEIATEIKQDV